MNPKDQLFGHLELGPADPITSIMKLCFADPNPLKVNLSAGVYADENGKPVVFRAVRKAEEIIFNDPKYNHEYLAPFGHMNFIETSQKIVFGEDSELITNKKIATIQTVSGSGALTNGLMLLKKSCPGVVYISKPTWPVHGPMVAIQGLPSREYPYWDAATKTIDFEKMAAFLGTCPAGSIVILHGCAHNPTGSDLTNEQWDRLAVILQENKLIPFVDLAYQGFATGDLDNDAYAVRLLASKRFTFLVAQSFAKNFGLYGERIGALHVVCQDADSAKLVCNHLETIARNSYLCPPLHGALIVDTIWRNPELRSEYKVQLAEVFARINQARVLLRAELEKLNVPGSWSHITDQRGMFSFTGLTTAQCGYLLQSLSVYILASGRANMAGINPSNATRVAEAFKEAIEQNP